MDERSGWPQEEGTWDGDISYIYVVMRFIFIVVAVLDCTVLYCKGERPQWW